PPGQHRTRERIRPKRTHSVGLNSNAPASGSAVEEPSPSTGRGRPVKSHGVAASGLAESTAGLDAPSWKSSQAPDGDATTNPGEAVTRLPRSTLLLVAPVLPGDVPATRLLKMLTLLAEPEI